MKIGFLGAGSVGQTLATKLAANGHDVILGIRTVSPAELAKPRQNAQPLDHWSKTTTARIVTFAEAADHGEIIFNVTPGEHSLAAIAAAGAAPLSGKILIDVANPLDFLRGMPPSLYPALSNTTSVGEQIQAALPGTHVVKAFNTVGAPIMVNPGAISGPHDLFLSGNDAGAKEEVTAFARREFGWSTIHDLGDITGARAQEALLLFWIRIWASSGNPAFNLHIAR
jgi:8-hydroxy-5-deazaflavin:NADPH oxidoreductase